MKIISGGQTGADIAGLKMAKKHKFKTGGYMPCGFLTLDGVKPQYKELYNMQETKSSDYPTRTKLNVQNSDCIIWLGPNEVSRGKMCTFKHIKASNKASLDIDIDKPKSIKSVCKWIVDNEFSIINIAGKSETLNNNMEEKVSAYLDKLFVELTNN